MFHVRFCHRIVLGHKVRIVRKICCIWTLRLHIALGRFLLALVGKGERQSVDATRHFGAAEIS